MPEYRVTGGTGSITGLLVKSLLENGHTVRATVRDPGDEGEFGHLKEFKGAKERLRIMKADLMVEGSFDEAIYGSDGVFHTASPVIVPYDDNVPANLIDPCIKGTVNVLKSCSRASSVKRVVRTSSCSAIRYRDDVQQLWHAYAKTIAETEVWKLAEQNGIDLVVVNPAFVVYEASTPARRSGSCTFTMWLPHTSWLRRIREPQAGSYVRAWWLTGLKVIEMLRTKYPQYPFENKCSSQRGDNNPHSVDRGKMTELGLPPLRSVQQMFDDYMKSFQDTGYL